MSKREYTPGDRVYDMLGDEAVEEMGFMPRGVNADHLMHFKVMGSSPADEGKRPRFGPWLGDPNAKMQSFPDIGALLSWIAQGYDDDEVDALLIELQDPMATTMVGKDERIAGPWEVKEFDDGWMVVFKTPRRTTS